eukprot:373075_1
MAMKRLNKIISQCVMSSDTAKVASCAETASDFKSKIFRSALIIWDEKDANIVKGRYSNYDEILRELSSRGVEYEKWGTVKRVDNLSNDEIVKFYAKDIDRLMKRFNFQTNDIIQITPDATKNETFRRKFLSEHTHSDLEVRYFVDGAGAFYLHLPQRKEVLRMECAAGHLLVVPALTKHWFDMGPNPHFKMLRFFGTEDGWA